MLLSLSDQNKHTRVPFELQYFPSIEIDSTTSAILDVKIARWVSFATFLPRNAENLAKYPLDVLVMMRVAQTMRVSIALVHHSCLNYFICF